MLIGIAGTKNSGKDTVASMLLYIKKAGITKANYGDWKVQQNQLNIRIKAYITHFADPLKDVLSIIYNIPREHFDSRKHKDELYWVFDERRFINQEEYNRGYYTEIVISELIIHDLQMTKIGCAHKPVIKLRTLMQYFGTNICRSHLDDNIWIDSTIIKAKDIEDTYGLCIIPDVRFKNEYKSIMIFPTGECIKIIRDNNITEHSSENIDFETNYIIENNSTLQKLFYKVLDIYIQINKKQIIL